MLGRTLSASNPSPNRATLHDSEEAVQPLQDELPFAETAEHTEESDIQRTTTPSEEEHQWLQNEAYHNIPTPKMSNRTTHNSSLRPAPNFTLEPGYIDNLEPKPPPASEKRIQNSIIRKLRTIAISTDDTRRIVANVQGDSGANISATNDQNLLWSYQALANPIPVTTYGDDTQASSTTCTAIGEGFIKLVSNEEEIIDIKALFIPNSTGTIISPDHCMRTHPSIHAFNHRGSKNGQGSIEFDSAGGTRIATLNMEQRQGLWYTKNCTLVRKQQGNNQQYQTTHHSPYQTHSWTAHMAQAVKNLELWHQRMAHISPRTLKATSKVVDGMPELPNDISYFACPFCDMAKLRKQNRTKTSDRENFLPGTSFHMDLGYISGPSNLQETVKRGAPPKNTVQKSRNGHVAYLLIICASTKYIWAFPLKSATPPIELIDQFLARHGQAKHRRTTLITTSPKGTLAKSKSFRTLIEAKQMQLRPVEYTIDFDSMEGLQQLPQPDGDAARYIVRTDNGGELAGSHDFNKTVAEHGYLTEPTPPDSSAMNGLAERPNRTLKERVRCLLYTAGLGTEFWSDALIHVVWLYNRTIHRSLERTPYEAYTSKRPLLDHLLTFGCRLTPKKTGSRTTALDPHHFDGIFLGYKATTNNIRYWDINQQRERHAHHMAKDELQYGTAPEHRSPAAKHLIEVATGTHHSEVSSHQMKEKETDSASYKITNPAKDYKHPSDLDALTASLIDDSPLPYTASAAKVKLYKADDELIKELQQMDVTLNMHEPAVTETLPLHGLHPTFGLEVEQHPEFLDTVVLTNITAGTRAQRSIKNWRSRLRGSIIRLIDDITITSPQQLTKVIQQKRAEHKGKSKTIDIQFARPRWSSMNGEGLPTLAFDQLNVIAHHLRALNTNEPSWTQENASWPPIMDTDIDAVVNKGLAIPKLTRRKLMADPHAWKNFQQSEYAQLDKYNNQKMFGTPIPRPADRDTVILPWVWTYLYKTDPVTLKQVAKARGTCNGGPRYGKVVTLADTYAACVEQPAHRLTWALVAALNYIAIGADVGNAFAEAPAPAEGFYMEADDQFRDWWTNHLGHPPIPPGYVIPIQRNLQGHPEAPRLWSRHIDKIIRHELGFTPTTHEPCLYYKQNADGKPILLLRQVDDFLIAGPTRAECEEIRRQLQTKVQNPLNDLGIIKRFNGLDVQQTSKYIKLSCESYITKIVKHHGWDKEHTKNLPVPMRNDSDTMTKIQTEKGPTNLKEKRNLEKEMGFSYRQAIGELIFAMSTCRVDIAAAVILLSQYSEQPARIHYQATKAIFTYLYATKSEGLYYWRPEPFADLPTEKNPTPITNPDRLNEFPSHNTATTLHGASDATWANDKHHRRSVSGTAILLAGAVVYYRCKLQPTIALSSTESEFAAMAETGKATLYLRSILTEIGIPQIQPTVINADNRGAICMANSHQPTRRTKHVDIKQFAILQWTDDGHIKFSDTPTQYNISDSLTKPLGRIKFYEQNDILMGRRQPTYSADTKSYVVNVLSQFSTHRIFTVLLNSALLESTFC